jgi:hypothetical protein
VVGGGGRGVVDTSGSKKDIRKGCRRVNIVQMLCTRVCKWKNEAC